MVSGQPHTHAHRQALLQTGPCGEGTPQEPLTCRGSPLHWSCMQGSPMWQGGRGSSHRRLGRCMPGGAGPGGSSAQRLQPHSRAFQAEVARGSWCHLQRWQPGGGACAVRGAAGHALWLSKSWLPPTAHTRQVTASCSEGSLAPLLSPGHTVFVGHDCWMPQVQQLRWQSGITLLQILQAQSPASENLPWRHLSRKLS